MLFKLGPDSFKSEVFSFPERLINLHSMLLSCGAQSVKSTSYFFDGLRRGEKEFVIWQYTISGRGILKYQEREYELTPGFAMLVHIPHNHQYFYREDIEPWNFIYICLNGSEIIRISTWLEGKLGPLLDHRKKHKALSIASEIIWGGKIKTAQDASSYAYKMLMGLLDDLSDYIEREDKKPDFIRRVSDFCIKNLNAPIDVEEMSKTAGLSRYHFSRLFTKHKGLSPAKFLRELRLKRAMILLQTELLEVKEIAAKCGFSSSSYFCRTFQKHFGLPPDAYRNRKKMKNSIYKKNIPKNSI